jgi:hypothetical protein
LVELPQERPHQDEQRLLELLPHGQGPRQGWLHAALGGWPHARLLVLRQGPVLAPLLEPWPELLLELELGLPQGAWQRLLEPEP